MITIEQLMNNIFDEMETSRYTILQLYKALLKATKEWQKQYNAEIRLNDDWIEYRFGEKSEWVKLISKDELKGDKGDKGDGYKEIEFLGGFWLEDEGITVYNGQFRDYSEYYISVMFEHNILIGTTHFINLVGRTPYVNQEIFIEPPYNIQSLFLRLFQTTDGSDTLSLVLMEQASGNYYIELYGRPR